MPNLIVNQLDKQRLLPFLADSGRPPDAAAVLRATLESAQALSPRRIPADVVTMNSIVRVRYLSDPDADTLTLAYPDSLDAPDQLSVLAPLGASLLARRIGDEIRWSGPRGPRSAILDAIEYQPEREGHFDR